MTGVTSPRRVARSAEPATPRDVAATALVLGFAGAMWFGWAQQGPPAGWSGPLTVAAAVGLVIAIIAGVLTWRRRNGDSAMADPRRRHTYLRVVGVEVALIATGAVTLGIARHSAFLAPWILFVVGAHFVPLGRLFRVRSLLVAGGSLVVVSVIAAVVGLAGAVLPSAVAGAGGGLVMVVFGVWSVLACRRLGGVE